MASGSLLLPTGCSKISGSCIVMRSGGACACPCWPASGLAELADPVKPWVYRPVGLLLAGADAPRPSPRSIDRPKVVHPIKARRRNGDGEAGCNKTKQRWSGREIRQASTGLVNETQSKEEKKARRDAPARDGLPHQSTPTSTADTRNDGVGLSKAERAQSLIHPLSQPMPCHGGPRDSSSVSQSLSQSQAPARTPTRVPERTPWPHHHCACGAWQPAERAEADEGGAHRRWCAKLKEARSTRVREWMEG